MSKKSRWFKRVKGQSFVRREDLSYYAMVDSVTFTQPEEERGEKKRPPLFRNRKERK